MQKNFRLLIKSLMSSKLHILPCHPLSLTGESVSSNNFYAAPLKAVDEIK